jgi:hypothetical protein
MPRVVNFNKRKRAHKIALAESINGRNSRYNPSGESISLLHFIMHDV